jgi:two-component system, NtrC family, response regulator AtoC
LRSDPVEAGACGGETGPLLASENPRMRHLLAQVAAVAEAQATVLIWGESGTGKEVIARALHERSQRRGGPFVRVNCGALPEGLLESELFGHERGAFTGATRQRPGKFELADGGTLLLDEVGAAEAKVQTRLLRVLQEKEFERVGGTQTIRVQVRVLAATNADLGRAVQQGTFREDLYYRLNVVPLEVPPLRDRREDIPRLAQLFLQRAAARNGRLVHGFAAAAIEHLQGCAWPGNVRQLENAVERMVVLSREEELTVADIPPELRNGLEPGLDQDTPRSFAEARSRFEHGYLCRALQQHNGVIAHVAEAIGMSRKNLYTKLDQLQIDYRLYRCRSVGAVN